MFSKTSTDYAPWTLIPADNKKYARITAIEAIVDCLSEGVDLSPPALPNKMLQAAKEHLELNSELLDSLSNASDWCVSVNTWLTLFEGRFAPNARMKNVIQF